MTYTFEYIFLPLLVENSNKDDFSLENTILLDAFDSLYISFSEHYPQQASRFDWDQLKLRKEMRKDVEYWLITFPAPQTMPEAKWGIVVHDEMGTYHYFTFERTANGKYVWGSFRGKTHVNHGCFEEGEMSEEDFIRRSLEEAKRMDNQHDEL